MITITAALKFTVKITQATQIDQLKFYIRISYPVRVCCLQNTAASTCKVDAIRWIVLPAPIHNCKLCLEEGLLELDPQKLCFNFEKIYIN